MGRCTAAGIEEEVEAEGGGYLEMGRQEEEKDDGDLCVWVDGDGGRQVVKMN